jgi:hypothetical protein
MFLPVIPRLRKRFEGKLAKFMTEYRAGFDTPRDDDDITDIFDGSLYQGLRAKGLFER